MNDNDNIGMIYWNIRTNEWESDECCGPGSKVYGAVLSSFPSASHLFSRWMIFYGEIIQEIKKIKQGLLYEVKIVKTAENKPYPEETVLIPREQIFTSYNELKGWMKKELQHIYQEEKELISKLIHDFEKIL